MLQKIKVFSPFSSRAYSRYHHYLQEQIRQADVSRLVSRLRVDINEKPRKLSRPTGPEGRLNCLRHVVTALIKYERVEMNYHRAHEAQGYAERLISEAIRHGDCHEATMEMADYWILQKQYIHKLFKVLVPRFESFTSSYTRLFNSPRPYFGDGFYHPPKDNYIDLSFSRTVTRPKAVLELKGNPYPRIITPQVANRKLLHNVLLRAASEEERKSQVEESLKAQGLLGKSGRLQNILEKSASRLSSHANLGSDQGELSEDVVKHSRAQFGIESVVGEKVNAPKVNADSHSANDSQPSEEVNRVSVDNDSGFKNVEKDECVTDTTKRN